MNWKMVLLAALMTPAMFSACANRRVQYQDPQLQFSSEEYFSWEPADGGVVITGFVGYGPDVRIPPQIQEMPVAGIGLLAFANGQLTGAAIPHGVESIGNSAFARNRLASVTIPYTVSYIGDWAFASNRLTGVTIPDGVVSIIGAFANNLLAGVAIPDSVTIIGREAFRDNRLAYVSIPHGVTSIGWGAFANNLLTGVTIPDNVTAIGAEAFAGNRIASITIGGGVMFPTSIWMVGDDNTGGFDPQFARLYRDQGRLAGTYTYGDGVWSFRPR